MINANDIKYHKRLHTNNLEQFNSYIYNAIRETKKLLGNDLYNTISKDKNGVLLRGGEFQYKGKILSHEGLARLMVEIAYRSIIEGHDIAITSAGLVKKITPDSQPITMSEKRSKIKACNVEALEIFRPIALHIKTLYNCNKFTNIFRSYNAYSL